jgi:3-hydroxy-9,10-secoandrosta-1,3,5(10)-triene-9,17-dione monooxygenase
MAGSADMAADVDFIERARSVGDVAARHTREAERNRRMPDAVIDELVQSGLVRMLRPRQLGGHQSDPMTYVEVGRELALSSVAAGWLFGVLSIHEWYMAYAHPQFQKEVWGQDDDALVVDAVAPVGSAEPVSDGFRVSGRWRFASGVEWASWAGLGAVTVLPDGEHPEPCMFFVPRDDYTIEDEWHVVGLRGTASNTVVVDNCFVPAHRLFPLARVAGRGQPLGESIDDPLYKVPFAPMLSTAIYPSALGGAQQGLRSFRTWTEQRVRPYEMGAQQKEAPSAQFSLAECGARLDAAHALSMRYASELYRLGVAGESAVSDEQRARFYAWRAFIARTSAEVADRLFLESGANGLFEDHPMQQAWRDTHAAAQHVSVLYGDAMTSWGRTQLGFPGHPFL